MTEPLIPALHFRSASPLRPGAKVRVKLASGAPILEGVLRAIDNRGLSVEKRRKFFKTEADWADDASPLRRLRWADVDALWVRRHAVQSGLLWGISLALGLGWCGGTADRLTDGFPRTELLYYGMALGLVIGGLVILLGYEWRSVDPSSLRDGTDA